VLELDFLGLEAGYGLGEFLLFSQQPVFLLPRPLLLVAQLQPQVLHFV
jgi:hypothetical protein